MEKKKFTIPLDERVSPMTLGVAPFVCKFDLAEQLKEAQRIADIMRLPCSFRPLEDHQAAQENEILTADLQMPAITKYLATLTDQTRKNRLYERMRATEELMKGCWGDEPTPREHKPEDYQGGCYVDLFSEDSKE